MGAQGVGTRAILQNEMEVLEGEFYLKGHRITYHDSWCDDNIELPNIAYEPETNLHPEWQLKLARLLVWLDKNIGIQIYLNSHSPYFVCAIEYFADQYQILDQCNFYVMKKDTETEMYRSECVTDQLGVINDKMAELFIQ